MQATKSHGSNVDSYTPKYCAPSIPKHTAMNITTVFHGVKNRVQKLSDFEVNRPLNKMQFHAGPVISRTQPFQKEPKSIHIVATPVAPSRKSPMAQNGACLSCLHLADVKDSEDPLSLCAVGQLNSYLLKCHITCYYMLLLRTPDKIFLKLTNDNKNVEKENNHYLDNTEI